MAARYEAGFRGRMIVLETKARVGQQQIDYS
jgi:hypothetical protein